MENNIKKLSFKANGVDSFLQITDLKNSPGPGLKELGPASEPVVTLFQKHYPELIYKNIIINTPFWYYVYHRVVAHHRSQHSTKTKFIFARPYKVTETLLKYISPENIPVQYGGLKRENDEEFTPEDKALEFIVKGGANACIEIPVPEAQVTVVWEVMVVGCEVSFKEEFIPDDKGSYRILLGKEDQQKKVMKMGGSVRNSFYIRESGRIMISLRNASFQKKRVFCRYKAMATHPRRPGFLYTRRRGRCTPRYWASRTDEWPRMVPQGSTVAKAFGSVAFERYRSDLTLLEAASRNDDVTDAYVQLAKQASAALLNSYARKGYPFTAWEVKTLLILGLVSEETAAHQAQLLMKANEDCN
ncbi:hypothetical protein Nepgr_004181 [Nepenthes gracilis]|uniref:CRAL-TRIO domain-containing protein n=1 Tax=Nepenthes gracilis TaxID=150966 RepID=A0AAD3S0W1_NEPGR|nr:hypothetical protein Nepgr_004181 [Nepenthes gracilis]